MQDDVDTYAQYGYGRSNDGYVNESRGYPQINESDYTQRDFRRERYRYGSFAPSWHYEDSRREQEYGREGYSPTRSSGGGSSGHGYGG